MYSGYSDLRITYLLNIIIHFFEQFFPDIIRNIQVTTTAMPYVGYLPWLDSYPSCHFINVTQCMEIIVSIEGIVYNLGVLVDGSRFNSCTFLMPIFPMFISSNVSFSFHCLPVALNKWTHESCLLSFPFLFRLACKELDIIQLTHVCIGHIKGIHPSSWCTICTCEIEKNDKVTLIL